MRKTFATTTLALAVLAAPACKGTTSAEAIKLIPDSATVVGSVDAKAITGSQAYQSQKSTIESGEAQKALDAARGCNIDPYALKVTFGFDAANVESMQKSAMIFEGPGIGKKENLECIGKKLEGQGEGSFVLQESNGRVVLDMGQDGKGFVVNDSMVALAGTGWTDAVEQLIEGKGEVKPAVEGSLKDVVARAKKDDIWLAGTIPADMATGPAEGAKDAAVAIDLADGIAVDASVGFGTAELAKAKAAELQQQFDSMKGLAATFGIPQTVVDSVKIEAAESAVKVAAKATAQEIQTISEKVAGMLQAP